MYHIDHLRMFLGARRKQFLGRKDAILNQALAASREHEGMLEPSDLERLLGRTETALLADRVTNKPAYRAITTKVLARRQPVLAGACQQFRVG